jgi:hypothetical protein
MSKSASPGAACRHAMQWDSGRDDGPRFADAPVKNVVSQDAQITNGVIARKCVMPTRAFQHRQRQSPG